MILSSPALSKSIRICLERAVRLISLPSVVLVACSSCLGSPINSVWQFQETNYPPLSLHDQIAITVASVALKEPVLVTRIGTIIFANRRVSDGLWYPALDYFCSSSVCFVRTNSLFWFQFEFCYQTISQEQTSNSRFLWPVSIVFIVSRKAPRQLIIRRLLVSSYELSILFMHSPRDDLLYFLLLSSLISLLPCAHFFSWIIFKCNV